MTAPQAALLALLLLGGAAAQQQQIAIPTGVETSSALQIGLNAMKTDDTADPAVGCATPALVGSCSSHDANGNSNPSGPG